MAYSEKALDLRRRSVNMPTMFEAQNHPSLNTVPLSSRRSVYVGYMKTDPRSMRDYLSFEKKLKCPPGTIKEWKEQGSSTRCYFLSQLRTTIPFRPSRDASRGCHAFARCEACWHTAYSRRSDSGRSSRVGFGKVCFTLAEHGSRSSSPLAPFLVLTTSRMNWPILKQQP